MRDATWFPSNPPHATAFPFPLTIPRPASSILHPTSSDLHLLYSTSIIADHPLDSIGNTRSGSLSTGNVSFHLCATSSPLNTSCKTCRTLSTYTNSIPSLTESGTFSSISARHPAGTINSKSGCQLVPFHIYSICHLLLIPVRCAASLCQGSAIHTP